MSPLDLLTWPARLKAVEERLEAIALVIAQLHNNGLAEHAVIDHQLTQLNEAVADMMLDNLEFNDEEMN